MTHHVHQTLETFPFSAFCISQALPSSHHKNNLLYSNYHDLPEGILVLVSFLSQHLWRFPGNSFMAHRSYSDCHKPNQRPNQTTLGHFLHVSLVISRWVVPGFCTSPVFLFYCHTAATLPVILVTHVLCWWLLWLLSLGEGTLSSLNGTPTEHGLAPSITTKKWLLLWPKYGSKPDLRNPCWHPRNLLAIRKAPPFFLSVFWKIIEKTSSFSFSRFLPFILYKQGLFPAPLTSTSFCSPVSLFKYNLWVANEIQLIVAFFVHGRYTFLNVHMKSTPSYFTGTFSIIWSGATPFRYTRLWHNYIFCIFWGFQNYVVGKIYLFCKFTSRPKPMQTPCPIPCFVLLADSVTGTFTPWPGTWLSAVGEGLSIIPCGLLLLPCPQFLGTVNLQATGITPQNAQAKMG